MNISVFYHFTLALFGHIFRYISVQQGRVGKVIIPLLHQECKVYCLMVQFRINKRLPLNLCSIIMVATVGLLSNKSTWR